MINRFRLYNQHISKPRFNKPEDIVRWMGAMQAQDYPASLWAIGLRLKNKTERDIEKAIEQKKIVRSWPMRGTLHFIVPEDLRWMLKFLTPRVISRTASIYRQAELDAKVFRRSEKLISDALKNGNRLSRPELYDVLERGRVSTGNQRGLHILGHLAQQSLICLGPRNGKQHTFVLLDEWIPASPIGPWEEGLAKLAETYFRSHGPATLQDFGWWSGLNLNEVKQAIALAGSQLQEEVIDGKSYMVSAKLRRVQESNQRIFLLPNFDEYLVAYKDRSAAVIKEYADHVKKLGNGIFAAPVIIDGIVAGVWKRAIEKAGWSLEISPFDSSYKKMQAEIEEVASKMGRFANMPVDLKFSRPQKK